MSKKADHHIVYRFFATNGDLLYVGKTGSLDSRLRTHQATQPWFADVANIALEHCANGVEASFVEEAAIRTERPLHNTTHTELAVLMTRREVLYPESSRIAESVKLLGLTPDANGGAS